MLQAADMLGCSVAYCFLFWIFGSFYIAMKTIKFKSINANKTSCFSLEGLLSSLFAADWRLPLSGRRITM